jgi:hypothetical protein
LVNDRWLTVKSNSKSTFISPLISYLGRELKKNKVQQLPQTSPKLFAMRIPSDSPCISSRHASAPIIPQPPFPRARDLFPRFFSVARHFVGAKKGFLGGGYGSGGARVAHGATTTTCSCPAWASKARRRDASTARAVCRRPAPSVARRRAHPSMERRLQKFGEAQRWRLRSARWW